MKKTTALTVMLLITELLLIFHLSIVFGLIPYDQVWAGRLTSIEEMYQFETVSILINVFILIVLFIKRRMLKQQKQNKWIDYLLKAFGVFFAINTIGNLFAESKIELILGTAVTLTLSILFFRVSRKEKLE